MLPVGIFGVSMALAVFPPMARAAADGDTGELKRLLMAGLRKTLFLSIPSSAGMILIAKPLLTLVYLGGKVMRRMWIGRSGRRFFSASGSGRLRRSW